MHLFRSILVPYDSSDSSKVSLETALGLGKHMDADVSAVYVSGGKGEDRLNQVKADLEKYGAEYDRTIRLMNPTGSKMFKEVVRTSEDLDADLIIMGSHGTKGLEEFWIGSNAYRVVSSSNVPVITMQANTSKDVFKRLLVPIDQSKETRQKLPVVAEMAKKYGSDVLLFGTTKYEDDESLEKVQRYLKHSQELLQEEGVASTTLTDFGTNVAKSTLKAAQDHKADLIVMMDESEPSSGLFMGTNAQQVINRSLIPVLTLRAKDVGIGVTGY